MNRAQSADDPASLASVVEAGLLRRCGALMYEGLLLAALILVAGFAILPLTTPAKTDPHSASTLYLLPPAASVLLFLYYFAVTAAYCIGFWSNGRRTLPMKTWRLKLVALDGTDPSRVLVGKRFLAAWIGPIAGLGGYALVGPWGLVAGLVNYAWAGIDRDRRFLHDRLAGTRLIKG